MRIKHQVQLVVGKSLWEVPPPCCGSSSALAHGGESQSPAWVSLDLPYGVGSICSEAVRSIPHSLSLFSPSHIYPTVSSPHTKTDLTPATTAQRVSCSPTEQLGWNIPAGSEPRGRAAGGYFPNRATPVCNKLLPALGMRMLLPSSAAPTFPPSQAGNQRAVLGSKAQKIHQDFIAFALQL